MYVQTWALTLIVVSLLIFTRMGRRISDAILEFGLAILLSLFLGTAWVFIQFARGMGALRRTFGGLPGAIAHYVISWPMVAISAGVFVASLAVADRRYVSVLIAAFIATPLLLCARIARIFMDRQTTLRAMNSEIALAHSEHPQVRLD